MVCSMEAKFSWKIKSPWKNQMADEWFVGTPRCSSCLLMCTHKYIMEAGEPLFDFFLWGRKWVQGKQKLSSSESKWQHQQCLDFINSDPTHAGNIETCIIIIKTTWWHAKTLRHAETLSHGKIDWSLEFQK